VHGIASGTQSGIGALDRSLAEQMDSAKLFAAPLSETFVHATNVSTRVLTVVMIVLMSATTFTTQRQLMMKNMPAAALDNPFAQQQKVLLYVLPLVFAVSGVNFPIGVLIYWLTTNVWTMGQQFYVIRRMPAPGSPAGKALQDRRARRGHTGGLAGFSGLFGRGADPESLPLTSSNGTASSDSSAAAAAASVVGQRQQPKRQTKSRRSGARGPVSSSGGPESGAGPQNVAAQDEDEGERPTKGR
jgi:YidC/Oxa1 family membrane protein insertase